MNPKLFLGGIGVAAGVAILVSVQVRPTQTERELELPTELDATEPLAGPELPSSRIQPVATGSASVWNWKALETNDLAATVHLLRSEWCPEPIVRDIVVGLIRRRFDPLFAKLGSEREPFWQTLERRSLASLEAQSNRKRSREQLEEQEKALVRNLLGVELDACQAQDRRKPDKLAGLLDGFSEASRPGARTILQKFDRLERALSERCGGTLGFAEESELERLYSEKVAELRNIASPEELAEFQLRASPLAYRLKTVDLVGFSPTEEEFRAIFRIAREQGDSRETPAPDPGDGQLQQALGEKRLKDYQRNQDLTYRRLVEFASQYGYGPEIAAQVHDLRAAGLRQVDSLAGDSTLDTAAREQALAQLQTDAGKFVRGLLGDDAYGKYLATPMGRWIQLIPGWTNGVAFHDE